MPDIHDERVAPHYFRRLGEKVLLTNDAGYWEIIASDDFERYLQGGISNEEALGTQLRRKGFIRNYLDFRDLAARWSERRLLRWPGPNHHAVRAAGPDGRMSPDTAKAVIDFIFESRNPNIAIDFVGGEPLFNWPVVRFAINYAKKKNEIHKRSLRLRIFTSEDLQESDHADWLSEENVSVCALFDSDSEPAGSSEAVYTVGRASLGNHKAVANQLITRGMGCVEFRPPPSVEALDAGEFLDFYREALKHLMGLNARGVRVYERTALIVLERILQPGPGAYPGVEGLCRLAYGPDGSIYAGEEAFSLPGEKAALFRIGRAGETAMAEAFEHPSVRASLLAATSETQPLTSESAYRPFLSNRPLWNLVEGGGLWPRPGSRGPKIMAGILDFFFELMDDPAKRKVLEAWPRPDNWALKGSG